MADFFLRLTPVFHPLSPKCPSESLFTPARLLGASGSFSARVLEPFVYYCSYCFALSVEFRFWSKCFSSPLCLFPVQFKKLTLCSHDSFLHCSLCSWKLYFSSPLVIPWFQLREATAGINW